jgi:hypothetical protein
MMAATRVIQVQQPACDDRGWVVRTRENREGVVSDQYHWFDDEHAAERAYESFV